MDIKPFAPQPGPNFLDLMRESQLDMLAKINLPAHVLHGEQHYSYHAELVCGAPGRALFERMYNNMRLARSRSRPE